jgi:hypothetical protein
MIRIAWAARSARSTLAPTAVDHSGGTAPGCLGAPAASHQPRHGEFSLSKTVLPDWARSPGDREKVRLWGVGSAPGLRGTDGGSDGGRQRSLLGGLVVWSFWLPACASESGR